MVVSLLLINLIALGGMALTYLFWDDDESFRKRLWAGSIIGSAIFGLIVFVGACLVGFTQATILVSLVLTMLPMLLLRRDDIRDRFLNDLQKVKGIFQDINARKLRTLAYYAFFLIVFWAFFDRAVFETKDGLFTGGSNNYGDLPFHLGAIFGFTEGASFPIQNPSWAGAKFSYPFMADLLTACFVKLGVDFKSVIIVQDVTWAFALVLILQRFTAKLTNNKLAGRIAPWLLFFSGGLGFIWFFKDFGAATKGFMDFLWHMPSDYTINDNFRWGNPMVVLFITQRALLFGMPLTILMIEYLWRVFSSNETVNAETVTSEKAADEIAEKAVKGTGKKGKKVKSEKVPSPEPAIRSDFPTFLSFRFFPFTILPFVPFLIGMLAGTLPLVHLHSLATLFIITVFLFAMRPDKWREWVAFGVGTALIALPQLIWSITGSATDTTKFFGWHFGWDKRDLDFFWFWFKNTGLVFPLIFASIYLLWTRRTKTKDADKDDRSTELKPKTLLLFYIPFAFLFLLTNLVKLAPWEWDNIKILIYWYVGSIPLIAYVLAWAWQQRKGWEYIAGLVLVVLIFSGALDVWRTASGQINFNVFPPDAIKVAEMVKQRTEKNSLFLNGPTFNVMPVLAGRQSLMRYSGHLGSYGIDYGPREADVKQIYLGGSNADTLLEKYNIDYVLVSPFEKNDLKANDGYFSKFPVIAESGSFRVYKVKN